MSSTRKPLLKTLGAVGALQAVIYTFTAFYQGWEPKRPMTWIDDVILWLTVLSLFLLYRAGYRLIRQSQVQRPVRQIVKWAIPLVLISVLTIPFDSTDAFLYVAMARAQSHYGLNPYTDPIGSIPGISLDPAIGARWMNLNSNPWRDLPLVYGFLFANITSFVGWASQGVWWAALLLFKLLNVAAYALIAWMLWSGSRMMNFVEPEGTLYLFMWSPLILLHHIANAHNDLLMSALIAAAFYLILTGRVFWAAPVLAAGVLVKYLAGALIPLALFLTFRKRGWVRAAGSAGVSAGVGLLMAWPYLKQPGRFMFPLILLQMNKFTSGTFTSALHYTYRSLTRMGLTPFGSLETFGANLQLVTGVLVAAIVIWIFYRYAHSDQSPERTAFAWTLVLLVITCLSPQFHAWYLGALFPLALFLPVGAPLREFVLIFSITNLVSFPRIGDRAIGYFLVATIGGLVWWARRGDFYSPKTVLKI